MIIDNDHRSQMKKGDRLLRNYTSLWVRAFSCNFRQFLSTARVLNPGPTGMTSPEGPDFGTVRMWLSWDLNAEAPDRVGGVGWARETA